MELDKARELVTHKLNNELTAEEAKALETYLQAHPEFDKEIQAMTAAWAQLDLLKGSVPPVSPALSRKLESKPGSDLSGGEGPELRGKTFLLTAWLAAAAAIVIIAASLMPVDPQSRTEPDEADPETKQAQSLPLVRSEGKALTNDGFASLTFPEITSKGGKTEIEVPRSTKEVRLARARGLVVYKGPKDKRWQLLRRGETLAPGCTVRVPKHEDWGAVLLEPDGSTVTMKAGTETTYQAPRTWLLSDGAAYYTVAKDTAKPFRVTTPDCTPVALGTEFALYVTAEDKARDLDASTLCEVAEGRVRLDPPAGKKWSGKAPVVAAGKSGIADRKNARLVDTTPGSKDWLAAIHARNEADETMARLVADAGEAGKLMPLEINRYSVDVTVVDGIARTFLDMTFFNHTDRRLEGTFYYSLPADATVSQFQMYVGDELIIGEVLEQHRARQIFEYIRREQRDPALLEWAGGNLFKMRVYPIEPHSEKRVQLGYTQILPRREGRVNYTFPLVSEMLTKNPLKDLQIRFKVLSTPGIMDLQCPTHSVAAGMSKDQTRAALGFRVKNYTPRRDFRATWQVPDSAECLVLANQREDEKEGYFLAAIDPMIAAPDRTPPSKLLLVLDGSASVDPQSFSVASEFAGGVAEMSAENWQMNVVLTGAGATFWKDGFQAAEELDSYALREFLKTRKPLGGTDLLETFSEIATTLTGEEPVHIIYIGDGVDTLGEAESGGLVNAVAEVFKGKPVEVSCVAIGSSYDKPVLSGIASQLGGSFRAVEGVGDVFEAADEVLDMLYRPVLRDVRISFSDGIKADALYPADLGTLALGDTGVVLGRVLKSGTGKVIVSGRTDEEAFQREYAVDLEPKPEINQFLPRLWAKAHMDQLHSLMGMEGPTYDAYLKNQIIATSIHYQIMSQFTAFLVLESEEDYKKFGIVRTKRMVDWRGELDRVSRRDPTVSTATAKPKPTPVFDSRIRLLPEPRFGVMPLGSNVSDPWGNLRNCLEAKRVSEVWKEVGAVGGFGGGGQFLGLSKQSMPMDYLDATEEWFAESKAINYRNGEHIYAPANLKMGAKMPMLVTNGAVDIGGMVLADDDDMDGTSLWFDGEGGELDPNSRITGLSFESREKDASGAFYEQEESEAFGDFLGNEMRRLEQPVYAAESMTEVAERPAAGRPDVFSGAEANWSLDLKEAIADGPVDEVLFKGQLSSLTEDDGKLLDIRYGSGDISKALSGKDAFHWGGFDYADNWSKIKRRKGRSRWNRGQDYSHRGGYHYGWAQSLGQLGQDYFDRYSISELSDEEGKTLLQRRRMDRSFAERAVLVKPKDAQARFDFMHVLQAEGNLQGALTELSHVIRTFPSNVHLHLARAWLLHMNQEKDLAFEASQAAQALIDRLPADSDQDKARKHQLQQRVLQELANIGRHQEAGAAYKAMAEKEENPDQARSYTQSAWSYLRSAGDKTAALVWDRLLERFPEDKNVVAGAANAFQGVDNERALGLIDRAEKLGADLWQQRLNVLFNLKKRDEAFGLLDKRFGEAKDQNAAYQALYQIYDQDQVRARKLVRKELSTGTGLHLGASIQMAQGYSIPVSPESTKRLLALAEKEDLSVQSRHSLFYLLNNRGRNPRWAGILLPLVEKHTTKENWPAALQALQMLASYGYYDAARKYLPVFGERKELSDQDRYTLANARWQVEYAGGQGEVKAAIDHFAEAFTATQNEYQAYSIASNLLWPMVQEGEARRAVALVADMVVHFPGHQNTRYLMQNLHSYLQQQGELALLKGFGKLVKEKRAALKKAGEQKDPNKGREKTLPEEVDPLVAAYRKAIEFLRAKEYPEADGQLRALTTKAKADFEDQAKTLRGMSKELEEALEKFRVKSEAHTKAAKPGEKEPTPLAEPEALTALKKKWFKAYQKLRLAALLHRRATRLRPRVAAMTEATRAAYVAECRERAKDEDPVAREWTNRALLCLRISGDRKAYLNQLEALYRAEPRDPVWARRLVNARLLAGKAEEAHELLKMLLDAHPEDVGLAMSYYSTAEVAGGAEDDMEDKLIAALKTRPQVLQNYANQWQNQNKIELAVKAYLALTAAKNWQHNAWPLYQAADLLNGKNQKPRAAELYLRIFEKPEWTSSYGLSACQQLAAMAADETVLKKVEQAIPAFLGKDDLIVKGYGRLLGYHLAKQRNDKEKADAHLNLLLAMAWENPQNIHNEVISLLVNEKRFDDVWKYAREGGGKIDDSQRWYMMQNAANYLDDHRRGRPLARRLYRELIEKNPGQADEYRRNLIDCLTDENKYDLALKELNAQEGDINNWQVYHSYQRVVEGLRDKGDFAKACRIAYELWKRYDANLQNYGSSAYNLYTESCWRASEKNALPKDMEEAVRKEILDNARRSFAGEPNRNYSSGYMWNLGRSLKMIGEIRRLAEEAEKRKGVSVEGLQQVAQFYHSDDKRKRSEAVYRRILSLPGTNRSHKQSAFGQLYSLYVSYDDTKDYGGALEMLEEWRKVGGLDRRSYLRYRVDCLYNLKKQKDARETVRELLQIRRYRQYYWEAEDLANVCRNHKDPAMEVACLEHALRWMRLTRQVQPEYVSRFYAALGNAYYALNEKGKGLDAVLRGLSLINRNNNAGYYEQLRRELMELMKKDAGEDLEKMVAHYEKHMLKGGEMPQMRIAFAQAFRESGKEAEAIGQFAIAADLLPKDTSLRQEVIKGYQRLKQFDAAEAAYLSWARLDPQNIEVYRGLGAFYDARGDDKAAMAAYASMAEARPREVPGHRAYAQVLLKKDRPVDAITAYQKAIKYRPTEFSLVKELAEVLKKRNRPAQVMDLWLAGEKACRQSMEDLPDDPLPWLNLARFLNAQGKPGEARKLCRKILSRHWPRFARDTQNEANQILSQIGQQN